MAKKFSELRNKMSPESQERSRRLADKLEKEIPLNELRTALEITQEQLAASMGIKQAEVSKIERRTDVYVSTLAAVIAGMGGQLEVRAVFPEGSVKIGGFRQARRLA